MDGAGCLRNFVSFLVFVSAFCGHARAADLKVNCDGTGALSTINGALKLLTPQGPNTLTVSGACHENVVIQSFDRLSLIANPGASITDVSNGNLDTILITDSQRISISGFTINGGSGGINCVNGSLCRLSGNTIQGVQGYGVIVNGSRATLNGDTIQNNILRGLSVIDDGAVDASGITVQGNRDGVVLNAAGHVTASGGTTIQNNQRFGVAAGNGSTFRCFPCTITGNGNDGIRLQGASTAILDAFFGINVITGNGGVGVLLRDLSFASFGGGDIVTGNAGGTDVVCAPQFSATRGATTNIGGGKTNCVEP